MYIYILYIYIYSTSINDSLDEINSRKQYLFSKSAKEYKTVILLNLSMNLSRA